MEVQYTGFPTPEVHWYREGVEIQPSRDFQITHLYQKSSLVVPEVFLEDAGTFTVRAVSPVGMAECRALLVVDGQLSACIYNHTHTDLDWPLCHYAMATNTVL